MPDRGAEPAADYWSRSDSVAAMDRSDGPELYEDLLMADAVGRAGGADRVRTVHVLGVGTGRELPAVRRHAPDARILAWDVAAPMVEACRRNLGRLGLERVQVEVRDVAELTAADDPAELVVAFNAVFGYVVPATRRRRAIGAVASVLRTGGVLASVTQQRRGRPDWAMWFLATDAAARLGRNREPGDRLTGHGGAKVVHHHFTPAELSRLLQGSGMEVLELASLRSYLRPHGLRPPLRSPNPLVCLAVKGPSER